INVTTTASGHTSALITGLFGDGDKAVKSVRLAVWSVPNDQDDLVWYTCAFTGAGYSCSFKLGAASTVGTYVADCYVRRASGGETFAGRKTFVFEGVSADGLQASELKGLTEAQVVAQMGKLFTQNQRESGILASISMAQFILESGYGSTELAQNANNCFGMKANLSGNTWANSTWDGTSIYTKTTYEDDGNGNKFTIVADFRAYSCVEDSIADHAAYLLGAKNGSKLRYAGLQGETDYRKAAQIIKAGGYATSYNYVDKLCEIIERWNLTQFDL
ncbi:MAG: glucosaminidase domain-containing protein, partial [Lachnospiraceae bacterium]|nr:glucosaminidase domain-containing protein [Lachnospiraceae bacterium]